VARLSGVWRDTATAFHGRHRTRMRYDRLFNSTPASASSKAVQSPTTCRK
jgi:hypothetical protein